MNIPTKKRRRRINMVTCPKCTAKVKEVVGRNICPVCGAFFGVGALTLPKIELKKDINLVINEAISPQELFKRLRESAKGAKPTIMRRGKDERT